jgi:nitrite reductase/ring-hydroxylating ferredoxin subunit
MSLRAPKNPARPKPGTKLCALSDLAEPGSKGFLFRKGDYLFLGFVTRANGQVAGWVDRCPHAGMPMSLLPDRYLTREGDMVLCAVHGALFRVEDGRCVAGPCAGESLIPWPVTVRGNAVLAA